MRARLVLESDGARSPLADALAAAAGAGRRSAPARSAAPAPRARAPRGALPRPHPARPRAARAARAVGATTASSSRRSRDAVGARRRASRVAVAARAHGRADRRRLGDRAARARSARGAPTCSRSTSPTSAVWARVRETARRGSGHRADAGLAPTARPALDVARRPARGTRAWLAGEPRPARAARCSACTPTPTAARTCC